MDTLTRERRLKRLAHGRGRSEISLGLAVAGVGAVLLALWATDHSGHGEVAFFLIIGMPIALLGVSFVIAGVTDYFRVPGYRVVRWLPLVVLALTYYSCNRLSRVTSGNGTPLTSGQSAQ
ncbi:MAG TPA: hypothetical protein VFT29_10605 [Gemmatimonadaceae bacterium]|nr:hypothetical protein [Gemmatimonadaceae bacterium]